MTARLRKPQPGMAPLPAALELGRRSEAQVPRGFSAGRRVLVVDDGQIAAGKVREQT
ncbi:hypothetical protein G3480_24350 [Thiorhodococcus mannitoliphagus]|uniref:Uncharacterized protein n=1 Tax=Thiorhodococcus mannitoliphagus TaxID=329406 RepID=A0A6P1E2T4_9GAMM|nr:hypothetical protein [Thiorhodococcus mannitoliphagus]NEX23386.1 hypothetical protein [Thiorhodococcus mannitoliphagus]